MIKAKLFQRDNSFNEKRHIFLKYVVLSAYENWANVNSYPVGSNIITFCTRPGYSFMYLYNTQHLFNKDGVKTVCWRLELSKLLIITSKIIFHCKISLISLPKQHISKDKGMYFLIYWETKTNWKSFHLPLNKLVVPKWKKSANDEHKWKKIWFLIIKISPKKCLR